jgi:hypothetical protein
MRLLVVVGALIGLSIGLLFGFADQDQWPSAIWRASAAALIGGALLRWWGRVWVKCLRDASSKPHNQNADSGKESPA